MLKKIKIKGLFNKFDYEIEPKEEGITILTGPNGYGKTTILKIIYAVAAKNLPFFLQLPFREIVLIQEDNEIRLLKTDSDRLEIRAGDKETGRYNKKDVNLWLDAKTGTIHSTESLPAQLIENNTEFQNKYKKQMPDFADVYLIKEQRLLRRRVIPNKIKNTNSPYDHLYSPHDYLYPRYFKDEMSESFSSTIEEYATELAKKIKNIRSTASVIAQEIDSSFPRRLFDETGYISEEEFNKRYNAIREKQKSLSLYGLSATKEDTRTSFKEENAKALLVYLDDTEKKLALFDDILQKLDIFSTILNERQFVFKQLEISPEFGFRFRTEDGEAISLTELSSGEQQEVVLLYELLFKVSPDTLVLIDEPEISLHVAWQKEVLNDLLKIVRLQKIAVIAATHSPQIIDTHWDWVVDLWDLMNNDTEELQDE